MSKQAGRGGMGSHKHGISGHSGPSPKTKFMTTFDRNREDEMVKGFRRRRNRLSGWALSIRELFSRKK